MPARETRALPGAKGGACLVVDYALILRPWDAPLKIFRSGADLFPGPRRFRKTKLSPSRAATIRNLSISEPPRATVSSAAWPRAAAVSMRLFIDTMQVEGGIIGRAIDELRWPLAVHPGDELRVEVEIMEARLSLSKPGYGLLRYRSLTKNQEDKVVQSFVALAILPARSSSSS